MKNAQKIIRTLKVNGQSYRYCSLEAAKLKGVAKLPFTLKILLENLLRHRDDLTVTQADIEAIPAWLKSRRSSHEIAFRPARVLMQDFTGVPAVVDLAALRASMKKMGGDPNKIKPQIPVDLVIDHSVQVDEYGNKHAYLDNTHIEMQRNHERYEFLRWGQQAFDNFRVVPPGTGICHQVNLEYLAKAVWTQTLDDGEVMAYPDTLVGTDSHTTMINGLGVLGWGVGGIEAEAAMLGQPISMLIPQVIGFHLEGALAEGITATDLVLTIVQMLRAKGVVGQFVEFYGPGLQHLSLADRATIANMAPEYGATCGFFPIDQETLHYLELTNRNADTIALVKAYTQAQGLWHDDTTPEPVFSDTLNLDLASVQTSLAGPKRPQDRVVLSQVGAHFDKLLADSGHGQELNKTVEAVNANFHLKHGDVVIAAITSCTNTSNPSVMMAAGLLAKNAIAKGLQVKPWVKASLAPGSKVVTDYLSAADLSRYLDQLGFNLVGYGCTTCIGNSGPLAKPVADAIDNGKLLVSAVLSGNRNFEGRIHPQVQAMWLASPPLVVAYALAGTTRRDLTQEPLGRNSDGSPIFLKDIWPSNQQIKAALAQVKRDMFSKQYDDVFRGDDAWQKLPVTKSKTYHWQETSTYVQEPPFFVGLKAAKPPLRNIHQAHILALLGDSITTDHISPAGSIQADSPAGKYLLDHHVAAKDFNSYGARRGNHEVMMRGTFANIRIKNEMLSGIEGGVTRHIPTDKVMPIFDAAMLYQQANTPLVVIAGKEYGTGSSRDWAAKGTLLLGVKAVIAESFERIHRSNLIGMGVLPLQFLPGENRQTLKLDGSEVLDINGIADGMQPAMELSVRITHPGHTQRTIKVLARIDTQNEVEYYCNGGILQTVLRGMMGVSHR